MASIDLRRSINAISDVIANRPHPKREFDQIYMKTADMLLHADHVSRHVAGKEMVFVGDGDAIGLCLVHLHHLGLLAEGPASIHVLDFDEDIVRSVREFAANFKLENRISAELYNVREPLPVERWHQYGAFHINPPFGQHNDGVSVLTFMRRAFEAIGDSGVGCVVIADDDSPQHLWTRNVLKKAQDEALRSGFIISELLPKFHHYHLDDAPELTSCSMILRRVVPSVADYDSVPLTEVELQNFYGADKPLDVNCAQDRATLVLS